MSADHKINKTFVDKVAFEAAGQKIYRDSDLMGFALRVTSKSKVYIVERRLSGKLYRVVIGKHIDITATEARSKAQEVLGQIASGIDPRKPQVETKPTTAEEPTLGEAWAVYKDERPLKPKTLIDYNRTFDKYLVDWLDRKMNSITKVEVKQRHSDLAKESGDAQANLAMRVLRAIWNYAIVHYEDEKEETIIKSNPVAVLKDKRAWKKIKKRNSILENDDIGPFFTALSTYMDDDSASQTQYTNRMRDMLILILFTGFRSDEAMTLEWDNVDIDKGILKLPDPKNGDTHLLPMGDYLWEVMRERMALRGGKWVFPAKRSASGHVESPYKPLDKVNAAAGVRITMHDMRRTYGTIVNELSYGAYTIKRLLNHRVNEGNDVTGDYVQISTKVLRQAMNDIELAILTCAKEYQATFSAAL